MQRWLSTKDGKGLYREIYPPSSNQHYADEWPFSQAHTAALDLAALPGDGGLNHLPQLAVHRDAQMLYWSERSKTGKPGFESRPVAPVGRGGDLYYDD